MITQMQKDLSNRSKAIQWSSEFDPEKSDLFAHNEVFIKASCERVWSKLIDAENWKNWFILTESFSFTNGDKKLALGVSFEWNAMNARVVGEVLELSAPHAFRFSGAVPGESPSFQHIWTLTPHKDGCLAIYEEVGLGERAKRMNQGKGEGALHRAHEFMQAGLKWVSESPD